MPSADGCMDTILAGSVFKLQADSRLDITVIRGDGTTTAAKKGGDNIGFNGQKKIKGDKVVAFCDRNCNVIAPFVTAPGNRNKSPLLRMALPNVMRIARSVGLDLKGTIVSLDGVYDCRLNRKAIFNRSMVPNINANPRSRKVTKRSRNSLFNRFWDIFPAACCVLLVCCLAAPIPRSLLRGLFIADIFKQRFEPLSVCFGGRISAAACYFASNASAHCIMHSKRWPTQ